MLVRKGKQWDMSSPPVASSHPPLEGAAALAPPLRAYQQVYKHACSLARVTYSGLHADNVQLSLHQYVGDWFQDPADASIQGTVRSPWPRVPRPQVQRPGALCIQFSPRTVVP